MKSNIAAALDKTVLAENDIMDLQRYADATRHLYCAGCQHLCNQAVPAGVEIGTTLRYLMYHDSYGDGSTARQLYAQLPAAARHLDGVDFSRAAALCPHKVDVAKHMQRAAEVLA
jgi:predicted aldo/keto reductase-like oxidoreductase